MKHKYIIDSAIALSLILAANGVLQAQTTTNTNCNVYGSQVNCTSNTTDYGAQQRQTYETGQQIGNALGKGMAVAMQAHAFSRGLKKYCGAHPGGTWKYSSRVDGHLISSGTCPTDEDKGLSAANEFMSHHKDYIKEENNSKVMVSYLEEHKLDPREEKSYEKAYKDLKKSGQIDLYAK